MTMPTPYPDVNAVLHALLANVQDILGDYFVGLYLYGSLASGDFDPLRSDIDFVVVTTDQLPEELISALEEMHHRLWASGLKWVAKLEGTYIPQPDLRRYDPTAALCPCVNEGRFYLARHGKRLGDTAQHLARARHCRSGSGDHTDDRSRFPGRDSARCARRLAWLVDIAAE